MQSSFVWICITFTFDQKLFFYYYFPAISSFTYFSSSIYFCKVYHCPPSSLTCTVLQDYRLLCSFMGTYTETRLPLSDCAWNCLWDASIFRLIEILSRSLDMSFPGTRGSSQTYLSATDIIKRRLESNLIRVNHSGLAIELRRSSYLWMRQIALHLTFLIKLSNRIRNANCRCEEVI